MCTRECNAGNHTQHALAEVTGPDSNATLTWETQTNSAVFALAMAPSTGFAPLVLTQPPPAQLPTAGRRLLQGDHLLMSARADPTLLSALLSLTLSKPNCCREL